MTGGEAVVVQIAVGHWSAEALGQLTALVDRIAEDDTGACNDDRELGLRE